VAGRASRTIPAVRFRAQEDSTCVGNTTSHQTRIALSALSLGIVTVLPSPSRADNPIVQTNYTADPAPMVVRRQVVSLHVARRGRHGERLLHHERMEVYSNRGHGQLDRSRQSRWFEDLQLEHRQCLGSAGCRQKTASFICTCR